MERLTVFSPDILNEFDLSQVMVFICCLDTADIFGQLHKMGVRNYFAFYQLDFPSELRVSCKQENIDVNDIKWLLNRVEDDESRKIVKAIVEKRGRGFFVYMDLCGKGSKYFINEFFEIEEEEVL